MSSKLTVKQARVIAKEHDVKIRGNGRLHDIVFWQELTLREQKDFDYLDTVDRQEDAQFFRYRGNVYDFGDIMRVEKYAPMYLQCFDGFNSDSFFSGIGIIVQTDDSERVQVYTVIA